MEERKQVYSNSNKKGDNGSLFSEQAMFMLV